MVTDDVFAVIAEATRRDILVSLRSGDKAVGELVQELEASQPTISKHLKVLREADLVSMRAQGQKRYYALNPKPLAGDVRRRPFRIRCFQRRFSGSHAGSARRRRTGGPAGRRRDPTGTGSSGPAP